MIGEEVIAIWDDGIDGAELYEVQKLVRCKDCKHRYEDGEHVKFNVCELNHNKVQSDDWYCADGERKGEWIDE